MAFHGNVAIVVRDGLAAAAWETHCEPVRRITSTPARRQYEICILAGGLSTRMGRDKAKLRLGGRTLIGRIKSTVAELRVPVRVIRRDLVRRCGPLGGILTALKTARRDVVLFLSCDMPFVPARFIRRIPRFSRDVQAAFTQYEGRVGFPFAVRVSAIAQLERLIAARQLSLQCLSRRLKAKAVGSAGLDSDLFFNVNTPSEWAEARRIWKLSKLSGKRRKAQRLSGNEPP